MIINPQINEIEFEPIMGLDLETTGLYPWRNKIVALSLSTNKNVYVLDTRKYSYDDLEYLFLILSNRLLIGQNIKFDCNFIYHHYKILFRNIWDTMLVEQILTNGLPDINYDLTSIIGYNLNIQLYESKEIKKFFQMSFVNLPDSRELTPEQYNYAGDDTKYLIPVMESQIKRVEDSKLGKIVDLEHRLLPVLVKIEVGGCRFDRGGLERCIEGVWKPELKYYEDLLDLEIQRLSQDNSTLKHKYGQDRNRQVTTIFSLFESPSEILTESSNCFNYGSSAQIIELFKILGLSVPTVTELKYDKVNKIWWEETRESVDEKTLKVYVTENQETPLKGFIINLLKYREYNKLITTYGEKFLDRLDENNYIHTTYSQCYTDTGRLASRDPNLQNIPAMDDKEIEYLTDKYGIQCEIRSFFLPDVGHVMITSDMDGAEVRVAADYSQEPKLVKSILNDEDLHSKLASISYSIIFGSKTTISKTKAPVIVGPHNFISKTLRDTHKSVLFAKFYKGGAKRVYDVLSEYINKFHKGDATKEIALEISVAMDKELPKLSKYLTGLINEAKKNGFLIGSRLGRIRYFNKETVFGDAANFPIQNTNGEAMKIALIKADNYYTENNLGRIVLNIHDELVSSIVEEVSESTAPEIKKIMANSLQWFLKTIPGDASVSISKHWKK